MKYLDLVLFIVVTFSLIGCNELIKRKFSLPVYVTRKMTHFGGAFIAYASSFFLTKSEIIILCGVTALVLFCTRGTNIFSSIQSVKRSTLGEVFFPLGVILCALFFLPQDITFFQYGILIMGISDGLAGLVGEWIGTHYFKLFDKRKSIEGTSTFFITSLFLTFLFSPHLSYGVFLIPLILTCTEFFLEYGLDNLVLPITAAYLIGFVVG